MFKIIVFTTLFITILGVWSCQPGENNQATLFSVSSPDGTLVIEFELKANPQPYLPGQRAYYRVTYKGKAILNDSPLGLDFLGAGPLDQDFKIVETKKQPHNQPWENPFGAKRLIPDNHNQLTVSLQEKSEPGRRVDLIFRAYNEGLALRYSLPEQEALDTFTLASENTGFFFSGSATAFALNMGRYTTHYEGEYTKISLKDIKPVSIINLPLLIEIPSGPWVALLEADLTDYAGMYVGGIAGVPNGLVSKLSPHLNHFDRAVISSAPKTTPWRVLIVGPTPTSLIESNYLILNLNPPCALEDISWIKPGKAAWDWWSGSYAEKVDFEPGMNTPTMKHYIDFAAAYNLEYMQIDAGWYPWRKDDPDSILMHVPEVNIPEIIAYAKEKDIRVLLWVEWRLLDQRMDKALSLYSQWGAAGIKVDYMNRDDQDMVNFYERCVKKAAEHHMVVDFHGAYKPTGLRRTYPNLLTREGILAMEYNKWSERTSPRHDVTVPFTRMLAGPFDYTPGAFRNAARGQFKPMDIAPMSQGTRAHQLAMFVVYESPLVMLADYPEAYEGQPGFEFIEKVPTVWDDTKALEGEPGEYIVIARQKDNIWYVGAMTNWEARDLEIALDFLSSGDYQAQIFSDGSDADQEGTSLSITSNMVTAADKLRIHLAPGGGFTVILTPEE